VTGPDKGMLVVTSRDKAAPTSARYDSDQRDAVVMP
jgi:hypothetical protein